MGEDKEHNQYCGRLAPTPSGYLHEGHIHTFRKAWQRAREHNGKLIFRMDDLDTARCTQNYATASVEDIKKMGLDWDEGPDVRGPNAPYEQSKRSHLYIDALKYLLKKGMIYPCSKTRKEISLVGVMDSPKREFLFPKEFRPKENDYQVSEFPGSVNWRFRTPWGTTVEFLDAKKAEQSFHVGTDLSDFLVWRKDGFAAYELATVVDDYFMNITEVVRGEDLLLSSARQCLLFDAMGWERPSFYHCELFLDFNGEKLSKSNRCLPRLFSAK